jgi:hypothetical protein
MSSSRLGGEELCVFSERIRWFDHDQRHPPPQRHQNESRTPTVPAKLWPTSLFTLIPATFSDSYRAI